MWLLYGIAIFGVVIMVLYYGLLFFQQQQIKKLVNPDKYESSNRSLEASVSENKYAGMKHVSDVGDLHEDELLGYKNIRSDHVVTYKKSEDSKDYENLENSFDNNLNHKIMSRKNTEDDWLDWVDDDCIVEQMRAGKKKARLSKREWLEPLKKLPDQVIIDMHFKILSLIKKHYKLRAQGKNLDVAIDFCEQGITLSRLVIEAMKRKHSEISSIAEQYTGKRDKFFYPNNPAYTQYAVILKRQKNFDKLAVINSKKEAEGWGKGDDY